MQPKVGHYGVFNGSRFRAEIAPRIADFIATHAPRDRRSQAKAGNGSPGRRGSARTASRRAAGRRALSDPSSAPLSLFA